MVSKPDKRGLVGQRPRTATTAEGPPTAKPSAPRSKNGTDLAADAIKEAIDGIVADYTLPALTNILVVEARSIRISAEALADQVLRLYTLHDSLAGLMEGEDET